MTVDHNVCASARLTPAGTIAATIATVGEAAPKSASAGATAITIENADARGCAGR
jgi:hypothetical protein